MKNYDPENMEQATRSGLNHAVAMEIFEGRGTKNNAVCIDIRHCFEKCNNGSSGSLIKMFKNSSVDMEKDFLEVTSGPHTYLGGIRIDEWGRTNVPGLYAGGEAAGGVHGANRLGGAALGDSYVFGYRSGRTAAQDCQEVDAPGRDSGDWQDAIATFADSFASDNAIAAEDWRLEVQSLVVSNFGQIREAEKLDTGLKKLDQLEKSFSQVGVSGDNPRQQFNCMRLSQETLNLIQVARMLGTAARARNESRGGHFRLDCPDQDDANFLGNLVIWQENDQIRNQLRPVPTI